MPGGYANLTGIPTADPHGIWDFVWPRAPGNGFQHDVGADSQIVGFASASEMRANQASRVCGLGLAVSSEGVGKP